MAHHGAAGKRTIRTANPDFNETPATSCWAEADQDGWSGGSVDITGVFLHFNTECRKQAEDIQSFANGHRPIDCKKETYAEMIRMERVLEEQQVFLNDAWAAILRHVKRNLMPLEERGT